MRLDRATLSTLMSVWWWVGSDKRIIYWGEESSISVHWIRFLTDMLCFKCSVMVHVGVCINNYRILPSSVVKVVYCMFSQCGHTVCQCPSVFFNPELQCPSVFEMSLLNKERRKMEISVPHTFAFSCLL